MWYLSAQILPSTRTINIIGDSERFFQWLQNEHPRVDSTSLFSGYKFAVMSCVNTFIHGISGDEILGIENDFILNRALGEVIPVKNLPNSCEKTIFLKNILPAINRIRGAKNYDSLQKALQHFNQSIGNIFEYILEHHIAISREIKLPREHVLNLWLIDFAHTFLIQTASNGPVANYTNSLYGSWTTKASLKKYLEGYKYALQFLWYELLGEERYRKTQLIHLHTVNSWSDYKYKQKKGSNDDPLGEMFNQEFILSEQNCLDSYFYWLKQEITEVDSGKYGFEVFQIDNYLEFTSKGYNKEKLFKHLLDEQNISFKLKTMTWKEKVDQKLYWYSFEVVDGRHTRLHNGAPAFNTHLAGSVALYNAEISEFENIIVAKFVHPHEQEPTKKDYSYGILIDTKSTAGYYASGWVLYVNVCGDYSGFSGSEHRAIEKLIKQYQQEGRIELRELEIPLGEFAQYLGLNVTKESQAESELHKVRNELQDARAYAFELFVFSVFSRYYQDRNYAIKLNANKRALGGECDVIMEKDNEIVLIECKLNPQNQNMTRLTKQIKAKLRDIPDTKKKRVELWFWGEILFKTRAKFASLNKEIPNLKVVSVSKPEGDHRLKGVDLRKLKAIMGSSFFLDSVEFGELGES